MLRVFVSGVETISPGSHRDASLRSDLALVAGEKGDQSSAGNHLLALEVDEAPFDRVEVNVASTDASKGVGVDISCCDGHLTISPSLISALDHSDSLRRHNGLHRSSHRFQATSCPGAHHRKPPPLRHAQAHTGRAQRPFAGSAASCHEPHIPFIRYRRWSVCPSASITVLQRAAQGHEAARFALDTPCADLSFRLRIHLLSLTVAPEPPASRFRASAARASHAARRSSEPDATDGAGAGSPQRRCFRPSRGTAHDCGATSGAGPTL